MEDETTTEVVPADGGQEPQPESEQGTASAAGEPQPSPSEPTSDDTTDPDAELKDWASKKNLPLDDPLKLAKMYRDAEKKMHGATAEKSQLQTAVTTTPSTGNDDLAVLRQAVVNLQSENRVRAFYAQNPEASDLDAEMTNLVQQRPWLGNDLEALYALAKSQQTAAQADTLRTEGGKQALTNLANRQRAAAVQPSATTPGIETDTLTADNLDAKVAKMSPAEYKRRRAEIMAVMGR